MGVVGESGETFSQGNIQPRLRDGKKNSVPKRETHKRIDASSTIPPIALWVWFKRFF
jgi:hypothetical protein